MHNMVTTAHDLKALLEWYEAVGADCALDDAPQNRFEESQAHARSRQAVKSEKMSPKGQSSSASSPYGRLNPEAPSDQSRPSYNAASHNDVHQAGSSAPNQAGGEGAPAPRQAARVGVVASVDDTREIARQARSLEELHRAVAAFDGCSLKLSAKSLVFGDGNPDADVMFVGEAPGRDEDLQGVPFVGRAGQLLDKMMTAVNLDRTNSYITNILPWRPPGNRKPSLDEQELMQPFIHRHIELVNPKILVFLGGTAAQQLLGSKDGIMRLRGRWKSYAVGGSDLPERDIPAMATLHPAFLLRTPAQKRAAWQDLLEVAAKLKMLAKENG
ncbi:uracil-DNA glycosylase family protein [uncultured Cohaesibacter sp.]|uniref:uracil-DNA glycosylase n=1 Tax=uncultured Cohaesibacter sp. TaxID=1002546 RepID=UPI00292FB358|nr:uracil-DNA glycosylase family protein [uncultured Cohaesibacter sp.]